MRNGSLFIHNIYTGYPMSNGVAEQLKKVVLLLHPLNRDGSCIMLDIYHFVATLLILAPEIIRTKPTALGDDACQSTSCCRVTEFEIARRDYFYVQISCKSAIKLDCEET